MDYLLSQPVTDEIRSDLQLSLSTFDTIRRYQALIDPSAYFLSAWMPEVKTMRDRGITADYTRRPQAWENLISEWMLRRVHSALFSERYDVAAHDLEWTNLFLGLVAHVK
jgi:hypothetical protein